MISYKLSPEQPKCDASLRMYRCRFCSRFTVLTSPGQLHHLQFGQPISFDSRTLDPEASFSAARHMGVAACVVPHSGDWRSRAPYSGDWRVVSEFSSPRQTLANPLPRASPALFFSSSQRFPLPFNALLNYTNLTCQAPHCDRLGIPHPSCNHSCSRKMKIAKLSGSATG